MDGTNPEKLTAAPDVRHAVDEKASNFQNPASFYATLLPCLRETARDYGYALALHGSMQRDLDLIAVPWKEEARHPRLLVEALTKAVGGYTDLSVGSTLCRLKPHGRVTFEIQLGNQEYIDLSVISPPSMNAFPSE